MSKAHRARHRMARDMGVKPSDRSEDVVGKLRDQILDYQADQIADAQAEG